MLTLCSRSLVPTVGTPGPGVLSTAGVALASAFALACVPDRVFIGTNLVLLWRYHWPSGGN